MRNLDELDLAILRTLYRDASITNKDLAEAIGLSPSSCLERVRKLQADGIITGSQTQINLNALGLHLQAMVAVRLKSHPREVVDQFRDQVLAEPEVIALYHTGGQIDFMVHLAVCDSNHLRDFVLRVFTARVEVAQIETQLIFEHKISRTLPPYRPD
jgi:DNA-binding Lrp family transcriptional regulator